MLISIIRLVMSGRFVMVLRKEVICPIFFSLYFNDLIKRTLKLVADCKLDARSYNIIAYADEIALLTPSKSRVTFHEYCVCFHGRYKLKYKS